MSVAERLKEFMLLKQYSKADIARMSGIPYTTIDGFFKKGDDNVKLTTLKKLSRIMNCTLDFLAGQPVPVPTPANSPQEEQLLAKFRKLDADNREDVIDYVDMRLEKYERSAKKDAKNFG